MHEHNQDVTAKKLLSSTSQFKLNIRSLASPSSALSFGPLLATKAKTNKPIFKGPSLMISFVSEF